VQIYVNALIHWRHSAISIWLHQPPFTALLQQDVEGYSYGEPFPSETKNGFFTKFMFFTGPGGSGEGLRAGLSVTRSMPPGNPPENSLILSRPRPLERLRFVFMSMSRASLRGLGLFGSFLEGKLALPGLERRGDRRLSREGLLLIGLR